MRTTALLAAMVCGAALSWAQTSDAPVIVPAGAGPEPAGYSHNWELEFRFVDLRRITVRPPHQRLRTEEYWYLIYTVRNPGPQTVQFMPRFELVTSDFRVLDADMGIKAYVFDQIRSIHDVTHKYLVHPTEAIGPLRAGDDYARESVAIWRASDLPGGLSTIYVGGLSGEARLLGNPAYDPSRPETLVIDQGGRKVEELVNPRHFTIRKSLAIEYLLGGDPQREAIPFAPARQSVRWLMR